MTQLCVNAHVFFVMFAYVCVCKYIGNIYCSNLCGCVRVCVVVNPSKAITLSPSQ